MAAQSPILNFCFVFLLTRRSCILFTLLFIALPHYSSVPTGSYHLLLCAFPICLSEHTLHGCLLYIMLLSFFYAPATRYEHEQHHHKYMRQHPFCEIAFFHSYSVTSWHFEMKPLCEGRSKLSILVFTWLNLVLKCQRHLLILRKHHNRWTYWMSIMHSCAWEVMWFLELKKIMDARVPSLTCAYKYEPKHVPKPKQVWMNVELFVRINKQVLQFCK